MEVKSFFKKLIFPEKIVAGLEIKDAVLRIAQFYSEAGSARKLKETSLVLEPGIIEDGLIKNQSKFLASLKQLHDQFASPKDKVPVIAIVPSANVYTKVFSVPPLAGENLEQAAQLNLQSISPIEFQSAYADWQQVGTEEKDGKIDILGAFAEKSAIDSYIKALETAGFLPIAVEFSALAIARAMKEYAPDGNLNNSKVVVNLASDGIDFLVIKNGNLYFNYFVPWKLISEDGVRKSEISFDDFKETLLREIKKMATFYGGHWGGKLDQVILVSQALQKEITDFIKSNFNLSVTELQLRQFPDLLSSWYPVIGSAVRGTFFRGEDNFISLMAVGTEKGYFHSQIIFFLKIWRQVIFTTLGFILILFIIADSFLARTAYNLSQQLQELSAIPAGQEVAQLQAKATSFNQLVGKAFLAKEKSRPTSDFFIKLNNLSKEVAFSKIYIDETRATALLVGKAKNETAAINLKNSLIQQNFKNVSLPLSDLRTNEDGSVSFSITFSF